MTKQYHVYLGVPGVQFCWGTTLGVITSTRKHVAHPYNGGLGFSGVVDFNILWADAINLYEEGRVTHFAMLHGDILPDASQYWLDELLDVMDEKDAELVSAHLPIKDHRGITSTGICDPANPWGAFRRFTQREILHELPDPFNNVLAGYPEKPLLHNTGMWVADLRKPVFHETNADGTLKSMFAFPERLKRGEQTKKWEHNQESEDWFFSRSLWERGARNTWVTSRIRATHFGKMEWRNWEDFGNFYDGDENTAEKWRTDPDRAPLALTQMLNFELGSKCNLGQVHTACPNLHPDRYGKLDTSRELDDDTIIRTAVRAYRELGFTGLVGWIYYNEPLLQADRMFALMARIKAGAPQARFILWTNGMLIPEACDHYKAFSEIIISEYNEQGKRGAERLAARKINCRIIHNATLDNRLWNIAPTDKSKPCYRPFVELIIDNHGNTHRCCYDWKGEATAGNIFAEDFADIAKRWKRELPHIAGHCMTDQAPAFCQSCGYRWDRYQQHDEHIVNKARDWRSKLPKTEAPKPAPEEITHYEYNG